MKPASFVYHAPESLAEVTALLAEHGSDARCMAGGQSLIPLMNLRMSRPEVIIDLNRCGELAFIQRTGDWVGYGAMVRQRTAEQSETTLACCPLISKALAHAGPIAVRNRATVGGTLAHADRSAELPGVAIALDAVFELASAEGMREVSAKKFYIDDLTTAIEPTEFLRAVRFPIVSAKAYTEFFDIGVRREGVAVIGLAAQILLGEGAIVEDARLAVTGVESVPVRLSGVEKLLVGNKLESALVVDAADLSCAIVQPLDDPFVRARYRRHVAGALVKRALEGALSARGH